MSVLPIVRICNCQWNICHYTKCHTIKCHTQRIVIYLKLWLIVSIFIFLNEIQEKLKFIKAIEITNVTYVKSHFLIQGTWTHIDSVHNWQKDYKCNSCVKSFSQAGNMKTHIDSVHNGQKYHKCESCGKAFSKADTWRGTLIQFIMAKKITNVTHVESHFLKQEIPTSFTFFIFYIIMQLTFLNFLTIMNFVSMFLQGP